jgi:hypothetical protein
MEKQPRQGGDQEHDRHSAERKPVQRFQFGVWRFNIDRAQALITEQPRKHNHCRWKRGHATTALTMLRIGTRFRSLGQGQILTEATP